MRGTAAGPHSSTWKPQHAPSSTPLPSASLPIRRTALMIRKKRRRILACHGSRGFRLSKRRGPDGDLQTGNKIRYRTRSICIHYLKLVTGGRRDHVIKSITRLLRPKKRNPFVAATAYLRLSPVAICTKNARNPLDYGYNDKSPNTLHFL